MNVFSFPGGAPAAPHTSPQDLQRSLALALELVADAFRIANEAVVSDIETSAWPTTSMGDGRTWYDVRPMLDATHCNEEELLLNARSLQFAMASGVVETHPQHPHLMRVTLETEEHNA